jgi:rhamnulose-1-phosphate aldolase
MSGLRTVESWFVAGMIKATTDMWHKGWDERNGGNVTLRLLDSDVAPYLPSWSVSRTLPLGEPLPELAGQYYLATGSGKYFRNIQMDPETNLGIFRIASDGAGLEILWGLADGGVPTSELPSHLKSHRVRQQLFGERQRVVMHCHATNLIALTYVLRFDTANITRALWEGSTECLVVFPEGVAALDWMVPGTDTIGDATAVLAAKHPLVLWKFHGVFGVGETLDGAFGLIDTAEKSARILTGVIAMGGARQTLSAKNLHDLAVRFGVTPLPAAMELKGWEMADMPSHFPALSFGRVAGSGV